jgi:hypothetical protein
MEQRQLAIGSWVRIKKSEHDWNRDMDEYNGKETIITQIEDEWCKLSITRPIVIWWSRLSLTLISQDVSLIKIGSTVILGSHDWVNGTRGWNPPMERCIGRKVTVTDILTYSGILLAAVDNNDFYWRLCNMTLVE